MKMLTFAKRNFKELIRDPLNIAFGLGFPLVLLCLLSIIQKNIPVSLFEIDRLTPGITVFGLSFMSLFSATVISKDRGSSLLQRLYTTPMRAVDFIVGYTLPILPLSVLQCVICYGVAMLFGLKLSLNILYAVLFILPVSLMFVSIGLLCGSVLNEKQVGGICGALLANLSGWLSGIWFDLTLMGDTFNDIANCLPFVHGVELEKAALAGDFSAALPHLWWILGYDAVLLTAAVLLFLRQMKKQ